MKEGCGVLLRTKDSVILLKILLGYEGGTKAERLCEIKRLLKFLITSEVNEKMFRGFLLDVIRACVKFCVIYNLAITGAIE